VCVTLFIKHGTTWFEEEVTLNSEVMGYAADKKKYPFDLDHTVPLPTLCLRSLFLNIYARENGPSACWLALRERKQPASVRVLGLSLCTHRVSSIKNANGC
jgi:hypothetical protein